MHAVKLRARKFFGPWETVVRSVTADTYQDAQALVETDLLVEGYEISQLRVEESLAAAEVILAHRETCLRLTEGSYPYKGEATFVPHFDRGPEPLTRVETGHGREVVRAWKVRAEDRVLFPELLDDRVWLHTTGEGWVRQVSAAYAQAKIDEFQRTRAKQCPQCDTELRLQQETMAVRAIRGA